MDHQPFGTDDGYVAGQIPPRRVARNIGLAAVLVLTVGGGGVLAARVWGQPDARTAALVLSDVQGATVLEHGAAHAARDGEVLARGASVRTAHGGHATVTVLARRVVLGPDT